MRTAREDWVDGQLNLDPERLVFLDETAANTSMARRYGWAPRGERCRIAVPAGHWKTTTENHNRKPQPLSPGCARAGCAPLRFSTEP